MSNRDYRQSHLDSGGCYDESFAKQPFQSYMHRRHAELLEAILPRLTGGNRRTRVLDFACGTGRITSVLERHSEDVVAVDVSPSMMARARERCTKTRFFLQDITSEPLEVKPVRVATAFRFFGNAEPALRSAVLDALNPLIETGGYLIANDHRNPRAIYKRLRRMRGDRVEEDLTHDEFARLLRRSGFQLVRRIGIGAWFLRSRLDTDAVCQSRVVAMLDTAIAALPGTAGLCPDAIFVARKRA